jgi:pyruvate kinase
MEFLKKTKIVCTVGPASANEEMLEKLARTGMNVVRFNFSHDIQENHGKRMEMVRNVSKKTGINLSLLLDTKGHEIRTADIENGGVEFETGDIVRVGFDADYLGNKERFSLLVPDVYNDVEVGEYLLVDDGHLRLTVIDKDEKDLICRVENPGFVKTRKGINIPGVVLSMPFMSQKDEDDIRFGAKQDVDYIAASFVRRASDVHEIRAVLEDEGRGDIQIIVKIENQEGVDNIEEILEVADGVMVARGDLGVEVASHLVPIYQKQIIKVANRLGKPVITATHMLESMQTNPRPTRAEASDVANAVLDGTDAIMLSGESAVGAYPVEAVQTMYDTSCAMETIYPFRKHLDNAIESSKATTQDSIGMSIAETCLNMEEVDAVIAFTQSGNTARRISKFRPIVPVIAVTFDERVKRSLALNWGVIPVFSEVQNNMTNDDELASSIAKEYGIKVGRKVIIAAGYPSGIGATNTMKIIEVK